MKDKEYYLEQMKEWCYKLHSKKWWKPAIVERIMISHYVDKYLDARTEDGIATAKEMAEYIKL